MTAREPLIDYSCRNRAPVAYPELLRRARHISLEGTPAPCPREVVFSRCFIPELVFDPVMSGRARRWCSRRRDDGPWDRSWRRGSWLRSGRAGSRSRGPDGGGTSATRRCTPSPKHTALMDSQSSERTPIIGREGLQRLVVVARRLRGRLSDEGNRSSCETTVTSAPENDSGGAGRAGVGGAAGGEPAGGAGAVGAAGEPRLVGRRDGE